MSTPVAKHALQSTKGQIKQFKKYTVQPTGIWARINQFFAVDASRSTGIPMNPQFRNPPPGSNDPAHYDDPVTVPAADLAENPYWKRDMRRRYPKLSVMGQGDVVGLLTVGSAQEPKRELIGEAGSKELVAVKEEGEKGLAQFFAEKKGVSTGVLGPDGLPPLPSGLFPGAKGEKTYRMIPDEEQTYGPNNAYPCRTFE